MAYGLALPDVLDGWAVDLYENGTGGVTLDFSSSGVFSQQSITLENSSFSSLGSALGVEGTEASAILQAMID
ncbi:hypothetical protein [Oleidesulfovibrio sp.]|uniref:hypothetical protein n=1 Tax=Oleidesulfovibrio sp. TaxID=2909707 RepID=UPI003A86D92A